MSRSDQDGINARGVKLWRHTRDGLATSPPVKNAAACSCQNIGAEPCDTNDHLIGLTELGLLDSEPTAVDCEVLIQSGPNANKLGVVNECHVDELALLFKILTGLAAKI